MPVNALAHMETAARRAELDRRHKRTPAHLALVVPNVLEELAPPPATTLLDRKRTKLERLEELERELSILLSASAPIAWREMRRALWRLLRRARRELRAAERAAVGCS